jgi:hypothetical protein
VGEPLLNDNASISRVGDLLLNNDGIKPKAQAYLLPDYFYF